MLERAEKVAALSSRHASDFDAFRSALDGECESGNIDSCFAASELRPAPMFTNLSDSPSVANRRVEEKAQHLVALCRKHQPSACHRLGELVFMHEQAKEIRSLSTSSGLAQTIEQVLEGDGVSAGTRKKTVAEVTGLLKQTKKPPLRTMRAWAQSCARDKPSTCFLGAVFQWNTTWDGSGASFSEPQIKAQRTLGAAFQRYCPKYPAICARGQWHAAGFNDGPPLKTYRPELRRLCAANNADGCFREALALSFEKAREAENALYQKACDLGSVDACENLVEHAISAGDSERALGLALAACQSSEPVGCAALVDKFGRSRDFTSRATGRRRTRATSRRAIRRSNSPSKMVRCK
jgi:hypothetical protein